MSIKYSDEELIKYNENYLKKYLPKDRLDQGLKEMYAGRPVQYIVGNVDFFGHIINVDERVLIPRFETEELVEKTISYLTDDMSIIDLGTGSGCIAITLKKKFPKAKVVAVDI